MECEPLRTLVGKLVVQITRHLSSGMLRHSGSFSYNNYWFCVDVWFDDVWTVEVCKYLVRGFNHGVTVIRINLDDPLMFEKLEEFVGA